VGGRIRGGGGNCLDVDGPAAIEVGDLIGAGDGERVVMGDAATKVEDWWLRGEP
jgi:hypothetical protein